jgi:alpha-tubulin suppressor-like RCC1 family protein
VYYSLNFGSFATAASNEIKETKAGWLGMSLSVTHSLAIKEDGTLWSWGNGYVGDGTNWYRTVPVMIRSYPSQILQDVNTIKVELDGNELAFDQPPVLINNRTIVPLRKIFESLGAQITWDQNCKSILSNKNDCNLTTMRLTLVLWFLFIHCPLIFRFCCKKCLISMWEENNATNVKDFRLRDIP